MCWLRKKVVAGKVLATMLRFSNVTRIYIEKFDGRINFDLWNLHLKDIFIQLWLQKVLEKNISNIGNKKWKELDLRALSTIHMSLTKNILANFLSTSSAKELWDKLERLYQGNGISNRLLLKEEFHNLCMDGNTKVFDRLSVLIGILD